MLLRQSVLVLLFVNCDSVHDEAGGAEVCDQRCGPKRRNEEFRCRNRPANASHLDTLWLQH